MKPMYLPGRTDESVPINHCLIKQKTTANFELWSLLKKKKSSSEVDYVLRCSSVDTSRPHTVQRIHDYGALFHSPVEMLFWLKLVVIYKDC